jgi:uncharacterized membrane protein
MAFMRREWALRLCLLAGLTASAVLLIEYLGPAPLFCGEGGGCEAVRASEYAYPGGVPTPVFGVAFFASLLALSVAPGRPRRLISPLALLGALAAAGFLAIQAFSLGVFCSYCVVADTAALLAAVLALALPREPSPLGRARLITAALAAVALLAPVGLQALYSETKELPEPISREQRPGVVTIIQFIDFESSPCREANAALAPVLAEYGSRVQVVRKAPPALSAGAFTAARAACCAEELGLGDPMADELFASSELSLPALETIAAGLGADPVAFRECLDSTRPDERIARDAADAKTLAVNTLPTFFIGAERLEGVPPAHVVREHLEKAVGK